MSNKKLSPGLRAAFVFLLAALAVAPGFAGVVGNGSPASCTQNALLTQMNAGGTVTFNCGAGPVTIPITGMVVLGTTSLTLDGGNQVTLDGGGTNQILQIFGANSILADVVIRNIAFANGNNTTGLVAGGAIINGAKLTLENVSFTNNRSAFGGAIMMQQCVNCTTASMTVRRSRFSGNTASNSGGAIALQGGVLVVAESTFANNTASSGGAIQVYSNSTYYSVADISASTFAGNIAIVGGAIDVEAFNAGSATTISNSTFSNNNAAGSGAKGGAISVQSLPTTLTNNTIAGNSAPSGGGIYFNANATLRNSIVSANGGGNCSGTFTNGGNNLQFGDATCTGITAANPLLGALASNGGPTQTMALGAGSPAIDAGNDSYCPGADQRGNLRADGDANGTVVCDIGAFEAASVPRTAPLQLRYSIPAGRSAIAVPPVTITQGTPNLANEFAYASSPAYAFADFNGDGLLDIFVAPSFTYAHPSLPVRIFLNQGNGTFVDGTASVIDGTTPTTRRATQILIGDFNEDGKPDVLVLNYGENPDAGSAGGGTNVLLLSQANGKLKDASGQIPANVVALNGGGGIGDFNGDGHLDVVIQRFDSGSPASSGAVLYLGDGKGNFTDATSALPPEIRYMPNAQRPAGIDSQQVGCAGAADLDGDGKAEIITGSGGAKDGGANGTRTIRFFQRDANGNFVERGRVPIPAALAGVPNDGGTTPVGGPAVGLHCNQVIAGDLNGDGRADLVVQWAGAAGYVEVLRNDGNFKFTDVTLDALGGYQAGYFDGADIAGPSLFQLQDVNGDGTLDLVAKLSPTTIGSTFPHVAMLNDGSGRFTPWAPQNAAGSGATLTTADYLSAALCSTCRYLPLVFDTNRSGLASLVLVDFQTSVTATAPSQNPLPTTTTTVYLTDFIPANVVIAEFYNTTLKHFFITANPFEKLSVETGGAGPGWFATGQAFKAGGSSDVCRFYGNRAINPATGQPFGPNSHFYTIETAECTAVKLDPGWIFEAPDVFKLTPITGPNQCPAGTVGVLRAYNQRALQNDSNHRYMVNNDRYLQMQAMGWKGEGTVFCAAP